MLRRLGQRGQNQSGNLRVNHARRGGGVRDKHAEAAKRKAELARLRAELAEARARKPAKRRSATKSAPKFRWLVVIVVGLLIYGYVSSRPDEKPSSTSTPTTSASDSAAGQELHGIGIGAGVAALDVEATEQVVNDLYDNFGGGLGGEQFKTSWYGYIEEVGISEWDGRATVRTSLYDDADAVSPAMSICGATIAAGAVGARVTDASGSTLDECP